MPVAVRPLSPELAEKAKVELFEDPKKLEDGIAHLKEWIAKQPHLRARTDDQWLATFLRGCKYSLERAKEKIDLLYTMKSVASDMITLKYDDPKLIEMLKLGPFLVLPKTANPADPRVILIRSGCYDPSKFRPTDVMSVAHYIHEILFMEDDNFVVAGGLSIVDLKNASMAHFSSFSPLMIKKMMVASQDAAPLRMKGSHVLNAFPAFHTFFNIAKTFMTEKNKSRMHVYTDNYEAMFKHIGISKDILPVEYGGNGGTIQEIIDTWVEKIEQYQEFFKENEQYGTDETKRPGKPKNAEELFGVDGSFRQLEFD